MPEYRAYIIGADGHFQSSVPLICPDDETAKELLLRLRERQVRRELVSADLERTKELQEQLEKIRATAANLA